MGRPRIRDKRFCYVCGSDRTELRNGKWPKWRLNHDRDNNVICHSCFLRYFYLPEYRSKRYTFLDKRVQEERKSRKGMCSKCGKRIGDKYIGYRKRELIAKETHLHHEFYLPICPWFSRIELCVSCHSDIRWREWHERQRNVIKEIQHCAVCGGTDSISRWWYHHEGKTLCRHCWRNTVYGPANRQRINMLARIADRKRKVRSGTKP